MVHKEEAKINLINIENRNEREYEYDDEIGTVFET